MVTLKSTGSLVTSGLLLPLFEEAELGGGVRVAGAGGEGEAFERYPLIFAEADGDLRIFSLISFTCRFRLSFACSKCFFRSSLDQYLPI